MHINELDNQKRNELKAEGVKAVVVQVYEIANKVSKNEIVSICKTVEEAE